MAETSLPWGGTATGDAGAYSDDNWSDAWGSLFTYDRTTQGVVSTARTGYTGMLEVTNPGTSVIRVANGIAMVDGKLYFNTANIDETLDVPLTGTNYFRVVLKKDFVAQTVRLDIKEAAGNSDGGASTAVAAPAVTQTDGTTWEISLATVTITVGPVVTITDTRANVIRKNTRRFFVSPTTSQDGVTGSEMNGWPLVDGERATGMFCVPSDFVPSTDINVYPVIYLDFAAGDVGDTLNIENQTWNSTDGENIALHNDSVGQAVVLVEATHDLKRTYLNPVVMDEASLLDSCAVEILLISIVGDWVGPVVIIGWIVEYTANS